MLQYIRTKVRINVVLRSCFIYHIRTLVCLLCWVLNELTNFGGNQIGSRHAIASVNIMRLPRTSLSLVRMQDEICRHH